MLRAVIFDFNGIIVDDEPLHFELFQRVLAEEGIGLSREDYYARYLGFDDRGAFTAAYREHGRTLDEKKLAELIARKAAYYQDLIRRKMRLFPGVKELIPTLARELPLALASGALRHEIDNILATIGLRDCFTAVVSAEDVVIGKPDPEIFLKALSELNAATAAEPAIAPGECVVIEDSREGVRGARRAGMKCLGITNSHPAEVLGEATAVVGSLEQVSLGLLQDICARAASNRSD